MGKGLLCAFLWAETWSSIGSSSRVNNCACISPSLSSFLWAERMFIDRQTDVGRRSNLFGSTYAGDLSGLIYVWGGWWFLIASWSVGHSRSKGFTGRLHTWPLIFAGYFHRTNKTRMPHSHLFTGFLRAELGLSLVELYGGIGSKGQTFNKIITHQKNILRNWTRDSCLSQQPGTE